MNTFEIFKTKKYEGGDLFHYLMDKLIGTYLLGKNSKGENLYLYCYGKDEEKTILKTYGIVKPFSSTPYFESEYTITSMDFSRKNFKIYFNPHESIIKIKDEIEKELSNK